MFSVLGLSHSPAEDGGIDTSVDETNGNDRFEISSKEMDFKNISKTFGNIWSYFMLEFTGLGRFTLLCLLNSLLPL
jgi:hypothetical protein